MPTGYCPWITTTMRLGARLERDSCWEIPFAPPGAREVRFWESPGRIELLADWAFAATQLPPGPNLPPMRRKQTQDIPVPPTQVRWLSFR
jgi:hypothetical protein